MDQLEVAGERTGPQGGGGHQARPYSLRKRLQDRGAFQQPSGVGVAGVPGSRPFSLPSSLPCLLGPRAGKPLSRHCRSRRTTSDRLPEERPGGTAQRAEHGHWGTPGTFRPRAGQRKAAASAEPQALLTAGGLPRAPQPTFPPAPLGAPQRGGGEMAARVGLLLRALPLLLWGGLDARLAERVGQELRREAEVFLERYGYLSEQVAKSPSSTGFSNAIR